MYTLGTAGIKSLQEAFASDSDMSAALEGKLIAFVGTQQDRLTTNGPMVTAHAIFIEVPGNGITEPLGSAQITNPISQATVYTAVASGVGIWNWAIVPGAANPISAGNILKYIVSGSGWTTLYAFMRGNYADMAVLSAKGYAIDGLPFWAKDLRRLYIYNASADVQDWQLIAEAEGNDVPIGAMIMYPDVIVAATGMPFNYLACDGSEVDKNQYGDLYAVIGDNYGTPSDPFHFKLPSASNFIIHN